MALPNIKDFKNAVGAAVIAGSLAFTPATAGANDDEVASVDNFQEYSIYTQSIMHTRRNNAVGIAVKLGIDVKGLTIEQAKNHIENTCMGSIPAKAFVERDPTLVHTKMYFSFEGIESNTKYNADTMQEGCDKYSNIYNGKIAKRLAKVSFNYISSD